MIKKFISICFLILLVKFCMGQVYMPSLMAKAENLKYKGHYQEAILTYNQAVTLEPNNANYFFRRGLIQLQINNYVAALEDFKAAKYLNNQHIEAQKQIAYVYALLQEINKAVIEYHIWAKNCKCSIKKQELVRIQIAEALDTN